MRVHINGSDDRRLPPFSLEAEQGVLGCILLEPKTNLESASSRIQSPEVFYDLRHQTLYNTIKALHEAEQPIDTITLANRLNSENKLESVGGLAYITQIQDTVPSTLNLPSYLGILIDKYRKRRVILSASEIVSRAYEQDENFEDFLESNRAALTELYTGVSGSQEYWSVNQLATYDIRNDPNAVIGFSNGATTRYLCKGYGAFLISQAGIGKSTIAQQISFLWSLGRDFCGIHPIKPRRIIIIQAENDIGDLAESTQGILESIEGITPSMVSQINKNVRIVRCRGKTGAAFCKWMQREIQAWNAEIAFIDPLLRFAGIDVSRQDQCTKFLNDHLDPVLANTGAVIIGLHHTGKPKNPQETKAQTLFDINYAGIGSSDLANWARAISVIRVLDNGVFEMMLSKRGLRACAKAPNGEVTTSIFMKHARGKIFWEQCDPPPIVDPDRPKKAPKKSTIDEVATMNLYEFCSKCAEGGEGLNDIADRLEKWLSTQRMDVSLTTCKKIIPALVANGKLMKCADGLYRRGPDA